MTERTRYSREYKEEAVRLVVEQGIPAFQAARDLGINGNMLRRWIREYEAASEGAFPGRGRPRPEQAEIRRLQREVARLKAERDILKKAAAYFAKESV